MASLSIRKLDDETCEQLRALAARHGVSMEEEVRQIFEAGRRFPGAYGGSVFEGLRSQPGSQKECAGADRSRGEALIHPATGRMVKSSPEPLNAKGNPR